VTTRAEWVAGSRPRTLPAAVVPVLVGTGVAVAGGHAVWWRSLLALVVSLALQVGVNYANDYSDGVRGTDAARVGPVRLVASQLAAPAQVKRAAWLSFATAAAAGLPLALVTSPWLIAVGAACVAAAWLYTGGPRPYGYAGFGELFVFVFFGLVAVIGTAYVNLGRVTALAVLAAVPVGLLSVALLVVNNLRDLRSDAAAGKKTLAVRLGGRRTRGVYAACLVVPFVCAVGLALGLDRRFALLALLSVPAAARPVRRVLGGASGADLIGALSMTGALQLSFGLLLAIGIAL
jgi:1,4-dihydroxy-2-naphthoate octaprenyltransferase